MTWGKSILSAVFSVVLCATGLLAGEADSYFGNPGLMSLRGNAAVTIGGEVRVDYSYRTSKDSPKTQPPAAPARDAKIGDLSVRGANLRIAADVHPNIKAFLKLDLSSKVEVHGDRDDIVEEAMLVMSAIGGTGFGFFAGKGRAPYGQDITLGMLQSYHHAADQEDSSEGRIFVTDPPDERKTGAGKKELPPMRPGQLDRVVSAGVKYEWQDRWKVELAAFQPNKYRYESRLTNTGGRENPAGIGVAGRVWWMPFEDFVVQASAIVVRSGRMGNVRLREDIVPTARGTDAATAVSVGFDYRRGPWRVFGEYQHGWDWNFTKGYDTDTWQVGASYDVAENWRVGAVVEGLHIADAAAGADTDYYKAALNLRHTFANGLFLLAEYGYERRKRSAATTDKTSGHFAGIRIGFSF